MLAADVTQDGWLEQPPQRLVTSHVTEQMDETAGEVQDAMKSPTSKWPVASGRSRRAWRTIRHGTSFSLVNREPYARYVNERRVYKSGRRNPNYHAVQRTLEQASGRFTDR